VKTHIRGHFNRLPPATADAGADSLVALFDADLASRRFRVCHCGALLAFSHASTHFAACARRRAFAADGTIPAAQLPTDESPGVLPSLAEVLRLRCPVAEHIPTRIRIPVASVAASLHSEAAVSNSGPAFTRLMLFPKAVLRLEKGMGFLQPDVVRDRLALWEAGPQGISRLWAEAKTASNRAGRRPRGGGNGPRIPRGQRSPNPSRAEAMARQGAYRKALQACLSRGMAEDTPETFETLQKLHPPAASAFAGDIPESSLSLSSDAVRDAILSFAPGTACGASGWRAEHFRVLMLADSSARFIDALTSLVKLFASGKAAQSLRPHLGGATLLALNKKDGGVRPIAIGEVHRRLTSKVTLAALSSNAKKALGRAQFGAGSPSGTERVAHLMRRLVNAHRNDPDFVVLKVDIENAFNSLSRPALLRAAVKHAPEIAGWIEWLYGSPTMLSYGEKLVTSASGVQQGDPLGPYLFSLAIAPVLAELDAKGLLGNFWYLDDGVIAGPAAKVDDAYNLLSRRFADIGLRVKVSKCEYVTFRANDSCPYPGMKHLEGNFPILGTPIGSDEYVTSYCEEKILAKARDVCAAMKRIDDPQVRYVILRQCMAFGPLVPCMRTVPPRQLAPTARAYDALVRKAFSDILGPAPSPLSDRAWEQASLGLKAGGLGLRQTSAHLASAFSAACHSSASHDKWDLASDAAYKEAVSQWQSQCPGVALLSDMSQKQLSLTVDNASYWKLYRSIPDTEKRERGRLRAVSGPDAGAFFNAMPCKALHLALPPAHFRIVVRWWLGMPLYPTTHNCPRCGVKCDLQGYHSLTCRHGGDLGVRHNALRNVVLLAASSAALCPRAEQCILPGSQARPADLLYTSDSVTTVCDFAVTHPLQEAYLSQLLNPKGSVSHAAESYATAHKTKSTGDAVEAEGYKFAPCVVDAFGNWCAAGREVLHDVAQALHFRDGRPTAYHMKLLIQRCAVVLALSSARALLGRIDHSQVPQDGLPDDFDPSEEAPLPAAFRNKNLAAGEGDRPGVT